MWWARTSRAVSPGSPGAWTATPSGARARYRMRGRDFAGVIEDLGPAVTGWHVGDEVLGEHVATLAEYAAVPRTASPATHGAVVRGRRGPGQLRW